MLRGNSLGYTLYLQMTKVSMSADLHILIVIIPNPDLRMERHDFILYSGAQGLTL